MNGNDVAENGKARGDRRGGGHACPRADTCRFYKPECEHPEYSAPCEQPPMAAEPYRLKVSASA